MHNVHLLHSILLFKKIISRADTLSSFLIVGFPFCFANHTHTHTSHTNLASLNCSSFPGHHYRYHCFCSKTVVPVFLLLFTSLPIFSPAFFFLFDPLTCPETLFSFNLKKLMLHCKAAFVFADLQHNEQKVNQKVMSLRSVGFFLN